MRSLSTLLGAAILASPALGHVAIKPPSPDKALTPNSSAAPPGCKLLASDKGFPADDVWLKEFPNAFKKMKGTEGPDWWIQPQKIEDVQKAVNFAREHNVRLSVITSGHDFHGREDTRSGLRIDMASFMEPTVFSNEWTCGKSLKPTSASGRVVEDVIACKVPNETKNLVGRSIPQRGWRWHYFEKRDGLNCENLVKRHLEKRHGPDADMDDKPAKSSAAPPPAKADTATSAAPPPTTGYKFDTTKPWEWAVKTGFKLPPSAEYVPGFNKIKATGEFAYARVPAGLHNEEFFGQADASDLMTLGAQHGGVSVIGGWLQAGGHNPFVNKFGMAADNVVEFEVVTPDGKFQKVSECSNPELFWALRGGGGGTFGIVTAATVKVFPTFPIVVTRFMVNVTTPYDPKLWDATAHFLQQGATVRDKYGLQGYFYVYPNGFHSVLHMPDKFATLDNAKKVTTELMTKMEELAGAKHIEPKYYQYKRYKDWYTAEMGDEEMEENGSHFLSWYDGAWGDCPGASDVMMNPMLVIPYKIEEAQREAKAKAAAKGAKGAKSTKVKRAEGAVQVPRTQPMGRTYLDSRLLSDKMVNSVPLKQLAATINETFPRITANHVRGFLYGGGKMALPKEDEMGLLPAWRSMTYHWIINATPGGGRHDYNIQMWDKLFPEAGAYVNEASPGEPKWKEKFWGKNYPKLEAIKKKVDPNNVLWCSPCVGADMLTYDDERICKNANYPQAGSAPQTYKDDDSKAGIASLPGEPGISNPLNPIIQAWMVNKTLPATMPKSGYFKMAMGQGGSSGGKWSLGPGNTVSSAPEHGHEGMDMGHGSMNMASMGAPATAIVGATHPDGLADAPVLANTAAPPSVADTPPPVADTPAPAGGPSTPQEPATPPPSHKSKGGKKDKKGKKSKSKGLKKSNFPKMFGFNADEQEDYLQETAETSMPSEPLW